jgi:hypothetical protein
MPMREIDKTEAAEIQSLEELEDTLINLLTENNNI